MPKGKRKKPASLKVLQKKSTTLIRQEYMDYDYIDKLSDEEKQWLADFTIEHYNASVGKQKDKGKDNRFMKTVEEIKDCTDRNNLRNNDVYGKKRSKRELTQIETYRDKVVDRDKTEDAWIEILDYKRNNLNKSGSDTDE
jgi:hypothetical protein